MQRLSERDRAILDSIFDPFQPLGTDATSGLENEDLVSEAEDGTSLEPAIQDVVKRAISASEGEHFEEAFRLFGEALMANPNSAAILNDRAQALRLAGRDLEAMEDLNAAVGFSEGKGRAGVRALCQRGVLYRKAGRTEEAREDFTRASKAGSSFARSQLVALNPYAAMCNAMLREVALKSGES
ncbi:tetratricopeptide repeat protein 36 [Orussus abietinus]|uniref:tetratricopeptide repeat protein 36 n=1 Tax=Orussus abietinus TaxID=222816 RepID=UPI000625A20E|nr:tetratricopeptide repeat protein 36 [Orussus abietinus]